MVDYNYPTTTSCKLWVDKPTVECCPYCNTPGIGDCCPEWTLRVELADLDAENERLRQQVRYLREKCERHGFPVAKLRLQEEARSDG